MAKTLLVLGEYNPVWETHRATNNAIEHSSDFVGRSVQTMWCSTSNITRSQIETADGFWMATGAPYQSMETALGVIRYAREHNVPCLGTCQGFQHVMLEYARTFLGIERPGHAGYDPGAEKPFISELPCSLKGREFEVELLDNSLASELYGLSRATERYYCSYGISPDFAPQVYAGPIRVSGVDSEGEIRIVEYPEHPFMMGTLFVPQASSRKDQPHPLITGFVRTMVASR